MKTAIRTALTGLTTALVLAATPTAALADVPHPSPQAPPGVSEKVDKVLGFLLWGGGAAVLAGLVMAGIMMALGKGGGHGGREGTDRLWYVAGGAVVIGSASTLAGWLLG